MPTPFAYVTYIEHDHSEHLVSVHLTLEAAEDALLAYAKTIFADDETPTANVKIVETLAEYGEYARVYAVMTDHHGTQYSIEESFNFRALAAAE
jgi:hypothetical protein